MSRQVKCTYCGEKGNSDTYFKIATNIECTRFKYYCSKDEYELFKKIEDDKIAEKEALFLEREAIKLQEQKDKDEYNDLMKYVIEELLEYESGMVFPKVLVKRIRGLRNKYTYQMIKEAFYQNREVISWAIKNKDFSSEFNMVCYIMTIVESNINDIYKKFKLEKKREEMIKKSTPINVQSHIESITNFSEPLIKPKSKNNGIASFLREDEL